MVNQSCQLEEFTNFHEKSAHTWKHELKGKLILFINVNCIIQGKADGSAERIIHHN